MHLLIPYASAFSEACADAIAGAALPNLSALLRELTPAVRVSGDEWTLSPPHERVLAHSLGWAGADGCLPLAAWQARQDNTPLQEIGADLAWGHLTPLHWHLGRDHLTVMPPEVLALSAEHSRELFNAALPLFTSDGWLLHWATPTRWYVAHESLTDLPTASLDRVVGRNPDRWLPDHIKSRWIKRLQNEVQMLWYEHPANDARQALGLPAVNTVWLWGCGREQMPSGQEPELELALRDPMWSGNWPAWVQAWQVLDATVLANLLKAARAGQSVTLTLAGERHAQSWAAQGLNWWGRAKSKLRSTDMAATLASL